MDDYRYKAKEALARAKAEIECQNPERYKYAALELRFAMEAITYDRALSVRDEMPPKEYETWQPRKMMQVLHDIDPRIGLSSSLAYGPEKTPGISPPKEEMNYLGEDNVLSSKDIKKHYDALGSFLHSPHLKQSAEGKAPTAKDIKDRCLKIIPILDKVLGSSLWNINFKQVINFECLRCGCHVRKRMRHDKPQFDVSCFECGAEYIVANSSKDTFEWMPNIKTPQCINDGCESRLEIWSDQIKPGTEHSCGICKAKYVMGLSLNLVRSKE